MQLQEVCSAILTRFQIEHAKGEVKNHATLGAYNEGASLIGLVLQIALFAGREPQAARGVAYHGSAVAAKMGASAARVPNGADALVLVLWQQTAAAIILAGIRMAGIRFGAYSSPVAGLADAAGALSVEHTSAVVLTEMLVARLATGILVAAIRAIPVSIEAVRATADDCARNILTMRTRMTDLLAIAGLRFGLAAGATVSLPARRTVAASRGAFRIEADYLRLLTAAAVVAIGTFVQILTILAIT